jgi:hypothetical protein
MASPDAFHSKPATSECPVSLEGFDRICRATWIVTAGRRQEWGQNHLISANERYEDPAHLLMATPLERTLNTLYYLEQFTAQIGKGRPVCLITYANYQVYSRQIRKYVEPNELTKSAL